MIELKSEIDGTIQEILFREGQQVEQGQLLIRLDETKLAADVAEFESNFKLGQANFERARQLAQEKLISQSEYDQAAATFDVRQATLNRKQRELKDTRITAPFSGVIGARNVSPGQVIARNTLLTWLVDVDPVKVELNVPERFLGQLRLGQTLDLTVAAFGTNQFHGKVYFIAPAVDANTRTTLVKAEIPNPKLELKPGMFANLELNLQVRENAIVIPETALSQLVEGGGARGLRRGPGEHGAAPESEARRPHGRQSGDRRRHRNRRPGDCRRACKKSAPACRSNLPPPKRSRPQPPANDSFHHQHQATGPRHDDESGDCVLRADRLAEIAGARIAGH